MAVRSELPVFFSDHPPGFSYLTQENFVPETLPVKDPKTQKVLFFRVPRLKRAFSKELWLQRKKELEIENPGNCQIVIPHLSEGDDGYKQFLKGELLERGKSFATISTMTYANDVEARVIIKNARPVETAYIVVSPLTEKDFAMINNIAGYYKRALGTKRVVLVAPFLGFAREDKNSKLQDDETIKVTGQVITIASRMAEISSVVDGIITLEPHSEATQTWAAEYGIPLLPISMGLLMAQQVESDLEKEGGQRSFIFIRPDKGRNLAALRIEEFLGIDGVSFEKDRATDIQGETTFKPLGKESETKLNGKTALIYDDEAASLGTMKGVVQALINSEVKEIVIMLGHARFTGSYEDEKGYHPGWKENLDEIIELTNKNNVKIKFYISNSREPIGGIYKYISNHQGLFQIVDVGPSVQKLIETDIAGFNFWEDEEWAPQVAQAYPSERDVKA